jgi:hypothetical protein
MCAIGFPAPIEAKQIAMPAEKYKRLNDVKSLFPELSESCKENKP